MWRPKYLDSYLGWRRMIDRDEEHDCVLIVRDRSGATTGIVEADETFIHGEDATPAHYLMAAVVLRQCGTEPRRRKQKHSFFQST